MSLIHNTPTHAVQDLQKHPSPFFLADHERDLLARVVSNGLDEDFKWIIEPSISVDAEKLNAVLDEVERLAGWFDKACFEWLYGRAGRG
ncbi:hypothetical protein D9M69_616170 [compost metagenome]